jgi:hypothetical protein
MEPAWMDLSFRISVRINHSIPQLNSTQLNATQLIHRETVKSPEREFGEELCLKLGLGDARSASISIARSTVFEARSRINRITASNECACMSITQFSIKTSSVNSSWETFHLLPTFMIISV